MRDTNPLHALVLLTAAAVSGCGGAVTSSSGLSPPSAFTSQRYGDVDDARLERAAEEPGNWYTNGRDRGGSYYSPLAQINDANVGRLGLAWEYALGTSRGQEATPIVVDGVMYAVGIWGRAYALDAVTGKQLWTYDPEVDGQYARYACCDVVQRGLVVWKGRVYVGSTDNHLHAIDAKSGKRLWKVDSLPQSAREQRMPYTSSGSPQIAGDVIVLGNGGADYGVRGFVAAFDLESGELAWRFYTVPRDPKLGPQEGKHLEAALPTWDVAGEWTRSGGGGTAWDGMAYDPKLDLLYVGTGNGAPYDIRDRSPSGGDNLYLASILAIRPKTGELAWHFQQVPGERWDYTATQKFILDEVTIDGRVRQIIMQAPKNGFFYVLDRSTGELLSAKPFIKLNWTAGLDAAGRPAPSPAADYTTGPKLIFPGYAGGHNWQPMSRSAKTGLVYIPVKEEPWVYIDTSNRPIGYVPGLFTSHGIPVLYYDPAVLQADYGDLPPLSELAQGAPGEARAMSVLRAIDPVTGRVAWEMPTTRRLEGGVMSSGGNLVFQGGRDGVLRIYAADSGKLLKEIETGTGLMAAPMSYAVNGVQYVAIMAGYGGGGGMAFAKDTAAFRYGNDNRILVFKLDGAPVPMPQPIAAEPIPLPPDLPTTPAQIAAGAKLYKKYCTGCHVFGRAIAPDLRRRAPALGAAFRVIVLDGVMAQRGMGRFDDVLSVEDVDAIHAYLIDQARKAAGSVSEQGVLSKTQ